MSNSLNNWCVVIKVLAIEQINLYILMTSNYMAVSRKFLEQVIEGIIKNWEKEGGKNISGLLL